MRRRIMARIIFILRGVPEEEAEEIRSLLLDNHLDYYETSSGNWGISMPALWIKNEADFPRAESLLNQFHQERERQQKEKYIALKKAGQNKTIVDEFVQRPIRFIFYVGMIIFFLYVSIKLVLEFGY